MRTLNAYDVLTLISERALPVCVMSYWRGGTGQLEVTRFTVNSIEGKRTCLQIFAATLTASAFLFLMGSTASVVSQKLAESALFFSIGGLFFLVSSALFWRLQKRCIESDFGNDYARLLEALGDVRSGDIAKCTYEDLRRMAVESLVRHARCLRTAEHNYAKTPDDALAAETFEATRKTFGAAFGIMKGFKLVDEKAGGTPYLEAVAKKEQVSTPA